MLKNYLTIGFILFTAVMLMPETATAMNKSDAYRAYEIMRPRTVVRKYCRPCGDAGWQHVTIKQVRIKRSGKKYKLVVNGKVINLAYYYIKIHGNWVNIAMLIGMEVSGVPEFLPVQNRIP